MRTVLQSDLRQVTVYNLITFIIHISRVCYNDHSIPKNPLTNRIISSWSSHAFQITFCPVSFSTTAADWAKGRRIPLRLWQLILRFLRGWKTAWTNRNYSHLWWVWGWGKRLTTPRSDCFVHLVSWSIGKGVGWGLWRLSVN